MTTENHIAFKVTNKIIEQKRAFSFDELQDFILNEGGILRISPDYSIGEYIMELVEDGVIKFNPNTKKFNVL